MSQARKNFIEFFEGNLSFVSSEILILKIDLLFHPFIYPLINHLLNQNAKPPLMEQKTLDRKES